MQACSSTLGRRAVVRTPLPRVRCAPWACGAPVPRAKMLYLAVLSLLQSHVPLPAAPCLSWVQFNAAAEVAEDAAFYESYQRIGPAPVGLGGASSAENCHTEDGNGLGQVLHKSDDLQRRLRALLEATDAFFTPDDGASLAHAREQQYWTPVDTDSFDHAGWQGDTVAVVPRNMPQRRANSYNRPRTTLEAVDEASYEEGTPSPSPISACAMPALNPRDDQGLGEFPGMGAKAPVSPVSIALSPRNPQDAKRTPMPPHPPPMSTGVGLQSAPNATKRKQGFSIVAIEGLREGLQSSLQDTEEVLNGCLKRVSVKARELETRLLVADARTQKTALFLARSKADGNPSPSPHRRNANKNDVAHGPAEAGGGENLQDAALNAETSKVFEEWIISQEQQLEGLRDVAVAKLSACEQGAARICGDFVALKGHLVRQKAHKDAVDELLSESESSMAATSQAKLELEIEKRMLRSELDALRQFVATGRGAEEGENTRYQEIIHNLRQECERMTAECASLKDTNSQLTRKLSASLKNKVELEKVQNVREQLQVR